jgi:hypothetical protein
MTNGWQLKRAKRHPMAEEARRVSGMPMRPPVFSSKKLKNVFIGSVILMNMVLLVRHRQFYSHNVPTPGNVKRHY